MNSFDFSASRVNQATKGLRWMPWRQMPMKDVGHCDKPRGAVYRLRSGDFRMGKPAVVNQRHLPAEHIGWEKGTWGTETS
jgi:hypothetical protein